MFERATRILLNLYADEYAPSLPKAFLGVEQILAGPSFSREPGERFTISYGPRDVA